jgi:hypothetical protein
MDFLKPMLVLRHLRHLRLNPVFSGTEADPVYFSLASSSWMRVRWSSCFTRSKAF